MKTKTLLVFAALFICFNLNAQVAQTAKKVYEYLPYVDVTAGYVLDKDLNAIKGSVSFNNLLLKRIGVYTSVEKGLSSDYLSHIIGLTGTVYKSIYLFAGMDWYTKHGYFTNDGFENTRKEMGIGFSPWKFTVVRFGWSFAVGPTIAAGVKIKL
jgi:hypothetical protein